MSQQIAVFISALVLFIYIVVSSVSIGNTIFFLFPKLVKNEESTRHAIKPVWEIMHFFLLFFIFTLFSFFPGSIPLLGWQLFIPFVLGILALSIRMFCIFYIHYAQKVQRIISYILAGTSFLVPLSFGFFYTITVTGEYNISVAILFSALIILCILLLSGTFFRFYEKTVYNISDNAGLDTFIKEVFLFLALFVLITPVILIKFAPYMLLDIPKDIVCGTVILVSFGMFYLLEQRSYIFAEFLAACLVLEALFFSLVAMHVPYILYPDITIYNSFTTYDLFNALMFGMGLGILIFIPTLLFIYYLFLFGRKD